jgi:hypothetical protein
VTSFGYSTLLNFRSDHQENYSTYVQNFSGLFANSNSVNLVLSFLAWKEANNRALCYDLGAASADPTVLSTASSPILTDAYWNVTYIEGPPTSPWMQSWSSANLAFTEADLGGASGGLYNSPTIEIGGETSDGWGISGTLAEVVV